MKSHIGFRIVSAALGLLLAAAALFAQRNAGDFLTDDEISQIRDAQDPDERIPLYLKFARLRLELVKQAMAVEKPGRSRLIHDNIEDYTHIIEAIDSVIDDALVRKLDLGKTMDAVAAREKEFAATLKALDAQKAKDRYLFDFALKDAIDATNDSLEESEHDLGQRTQRLADEGSREKKEREAMMTPAEKEKRKGDDAAEAKSAEDKSKKTPKAPTLRRKGEAPPDQR